MIYIFIHKKNESRRKSMFFVFFFFFRFFFDLAIHGVSYVFSVYVCLCAIVRSCSLFVFLSFLFFSLHALSFLCCSRIWRYFVTKVRLFMESDLLQHSSKVLLLICLFVYVCVFRWNKIHVLSCPRKKKAERFCFIVSKWSVKDFVRVFMMINKRERKNKLIKFLFETLRACLLFLLLKKNEKIFI